jgi:hypothetical protein
MNAEQALAAMEAAEVRCGAELAAAMVEARACFAAMAKREALQRNALEHIANTYPGRAAEVARAGLSEPREPQA